MAFDHDEDLRQSLKAWAKGYLLKDAARRDCRRGADGRMGEAPTAGLRGAFWVAGGFLRPGPPGRWLWTRNGI
jgi:hypothetical protein